jgi:hypothetical protein
MAAILYQCTNKPSSTCTKLSQRAYANLIRFASGQKEWHIFAALFSWKRKSSFEFGSMSPFRLYHNGVFAVGGTKNVTNHYQLATVNYQQLCIVHTPVENYALPMQEKP